jgi:hypothetical protein
LQLLLQTWIKLVGVLLLLLVMVLMYIQLHFPRFPAAKVSCGCRGASTANYVQQLI